MAKSLCSLCGQERKLVNSHIIPESFYKIYEDFDPALQKIWNTKGKPPKRSPKGIYDQIFCELCERRFSSADDYIKTFLNDKNRSLRQEGTQLYYLYSDFKIDLINYFVISILFRADISQKQEFDSVKLGKYKEIFKEYLLGNNIFPSEVEFIINEYENILPIVMPIKKKIQGCNTYIFSLAKWEIFIKIDQRKFSEPLKSFSNHNYKFIILRVKDLETLAAKASNYVAQKYIF